MRWEHGVVYLACLLFGKDIFFSLHTKSPAVPSHSRLAIYKGEGMLHSRSVPSISHSESMCLSFSVPYLHQYYHPINNLLTAPSSSFSIAIFSHPLANRTINAIISLPRLDSTWQRNGRLYPLRYFRRITRFQSQLAQLLGYLPIRRYLVQLMLFHMLCDGQMEEVRLFYILVDVLRETMGCTEADHLQVIDDYVQMCQRRPEKLYEDLQNVIHMLDEKFEHQQGMTGVAGLT